MGRENKDDNKSRATQVKNENGNRYRTAVQVETKDSIGLAREESNGEVRERGAKIQPNLPEINCSIDKKGGHHGKATGRSAALLH
ncbi:hypothetical protein TNCV_1565501 [Trichonephila clavipes]|nr:hypothetical protein TNCV_1565501 [Trichonephila clavipes]